MNNAAKTPKYKLLLKLIPRVCFFFFWILDTFVILCKINFLRGLDQARIMYHWALLWTIANLTGILSSIVELVELAKAEAKLIAQKRNLVSNDVQQMEKGQSEQDFAIKEADIKKKRFDQTLLLLKSLGDSVTST